MGEITTRLAASMPRSFIGVNSSDSPVLLLTTLLLNIDAICLLTKTCFYPSAGKIIAH